MDNSTHKNLGDKFARAEGYYDKRMTTLIGEKWKSYLRPHKTSEVVADLRNLNNATKPHTTSTKGTTLMVYGIFDDIVPYKTEVFNILLRNHREVVMTDDAELMQLNFDEIEAIADTEINNVLELEIVDFLWLDLCQTRNKFAPYQIMRLLNKRQQAGKCTIVYSPGDTADPEMWKHHYVLMEFVNYLTNLKKKNSKKVQNFNGK